MQITIRLLNSDDAAIFRALRIEAVTVAPTALTESIAEITRKSLAECANQLQSHGRDDFVLGAFDNNNYCVGMIGFYRAIHAKQFHRGTLWGMYVAPDKRQQNIGSRLMTAAIEHVKNLSTISTITLCVTSSNEAAKRLYESKGFQVCGIEQRALKIDGVYFDEIMMQLLLPQE